ncbi:MAG: gamma carbonic anhydrase family protein [Candidatus Bathyarchaeota archaeon]|jgi:carbonic anhydrase/acetyltransferase-like protein (isoleucine patch superfamily)
MSVVEFRGKKPKVAESVFQAPGSFIIGEVTIDEGSGVWNGAVVRGDDDSVEIGARSTVLENCIVEAPVGNPVSIGDDATISHGAIVHGATVGDRALVGIGAIVLDGAEVGEGAVIGAGAVVPPRSVIPPNTLALGVPAKPVREVRAEERNMINQEQSRVISKAEAYKKIFVK